MKDGEERGYSPALIAGFAAYVVASYCLLLLDGGTVDRLVEEDGPIEWVGTIGLFVASGCFLWAFVATGREPLRGRCGGVKRAALLALGLLLFAAAGEEISWGQRLLGIATPESLNAHSTQDETNLHNLDLFQNVLSVDRLFQLFWVGFAVAVPVAARLWTAARRLLDRCLPILPLSVALLFVLNQAVELLFQWFLERNPDLYESAYAVTSSTVEIVESNVGLLLGLGAFAVARGLRREQRDAGDLSDPRRRPLPVDATPPPAT